WAPVERLPSLDCMVSQDFSPVPLDAAHLAAALRPFGESWMPPTAYTSAEVFAWERRHFFGGGWACAGLAARLPAVEWHGLVLVDGSVRRARAAVAGRG